MPYVPLNVPAYTASFAGAIAGMATSGWITDQTSANYADVNLIAGAFAQAFDMVWNNATPLNNLELAAITSVVQTDFNGRGPGPFNNPQFQNPTNWTLAAGACAALILESDIFFAGQGINPGTPNVGGGIPAPATSQQVYVSGIYGSDVTGDGTQIKPYATVGFAYGTILDANAIKVYELFVMPSTYVENVALKAFVILSGTDDSQTAAGFLATRISGNFTLDAVSFGGAPVNQTAWITNIDIDGLLTLDFAGVGSTDGAVYITNCNCEGNVLITAGSTSNDIEFHDCILFTDFTIAGGFVIFVNTNGITDIALLTGQCTALSSLSLRAFGGSWAGSVTLDQNGIEADCILNSEGFSLSRGAVQMLATALTSPAIVANYGDTPENVSLTGAAAELNAGMRISHQFTNIAPNPTAIAGTAVTTIPLTLPVALIGLITDIEGMHSTCSMVGANWGAIINVHDCSITFSYQTNGTINVNIYNPGAGFNITDTINLNYSGYVPAVL